MIYNPDHHHRRSIRLKGYDYSLAGAYFITLCMLQRQCLLGEVMRGEMVLNASGFVVQGCWLWLAERYPHVDLDGFVVMPNHLHGIIVISDINQGESRLAPTAAKRKPLGQLVGAFKTVSARFINTLHSIESGSVWQRNYYEHIIRNEADLTRIREYILNNPGKWAEDEDNPVNFKP